MTVSDISLTSGIRDNLFALRGNTRLADLTQARLATGKRVNSPLDNPTNYFASALHISRAKKLNAFKDSMLEAIQLLKVTDSSIRAMIDVLGQASAVADNAKTVSQPYLAEHVAQFNELLHQVDLLSSDATYRGAGLMRRQDLQVEIGESSTLTVTGFDGTSSGYNGATGLNIEPASLSPLNISNPTLVKDSSGDPKVIQISSTLEDLDGIDKWLGNAGKRDITLTSQDITVSSSYSVTVSDNLAVAEYGTDTFSLSRATTASAQFIGNGAVSAAITNLGEFSSFVGANSSKLITLNYIDNLTKWTSPDATVTTTGNTLNLALNGGNPGTDIRLTLTPAQIAAQISGVSTIDLTLVSDPWVSSAPGMTVIQGVNGTIALDLEGGGSQEVEVSGLLSADNFSVTTTGPFRTSDPSMTLNYDGTTQTLGIDLHGGDAPGADILIDLSDPGWAVTNLPTGNGDTINMTVDGSHRWLKSDYQSPNPGGMDSSKQEIEEAIDTLRNKMAGIGASLSIIDARINFTDELSSRLIEGAENLTLADMNEEGANLLLLQTKVNLGITSLSLASQSAQSVLKLFF